MRTPFRKSRGLAALALIPGMVLLSGCWTLSIHPLYLESDLVVDPGLEGIWGDPESPEGETWQFVRETETSYRLVIREANDLLVDPRKHGVFEARLVRLGDRLFLDLFPETPETVNEYFESHVIPAHSFSRLVLEGHVLRLAPLSPEWLKENLRSGAIELAHETQDDEIVLTASTEELRAFALEHASNAFEEEEVLSRLQ
jgi:hypothetical protein